MRNERTEIKFIETMKHRIGLNKGQMFCETNGSWELWEQNPLFLLKRFPKKSVITTSEDFILKGIVRTLARNKTSE